MTRQDVEDLKEKRLIRVRVQRNRSQGSGRKSVMLEQWLVDVTPAGYDHAAALVAASQQVNDGRMDAEQLTRIRARRFAFLRDVYDKAAGNRMARMRMQEVAADLGLDEDEAFSVAQYLVDEGLLEWAAMGGLMAITHWGIKEIEEAIAAPDEATEHFPPLVIAQNYIQVGSMVGSAVQQGTQDSVQIASQGVDVGELRALVVDIRRAIESAQLEPGDRDEAVADLATLDAQLASPRAKPGILREGLASLQRIIESAVASGVASAAAPQLPELVERIAHTLGQL